MKKLIGSIIILLIPYIFFGIFAFLGAQTEEILKIATVTDITIIFFVTIMYVLDYFF